jgi:hypothetical protein
MPLELEYEENDPERIEETTAIRSLIWLYQHRWKRLSVCVDPWTFLDIIAGPPSSAWVTLSELSLWSFDFIAMAGVDRPRLYDAVENMTSLRRVAICDHFNYKYTRRYGPIGLVELKIYTDDVFNTHQANLIASYPNLITLTLIISQSTNLTLPDDFHLTLPSLSTFVLETYDLALLEYLTMPALARLEIDDKSEKEYLTDPHDDGISRFLKRCTSKLTSITLNCSTSDSFIAWALPQLSNRSSITHLTLNLWPSSFTSISSKDDGKENWLANLRHLTVSLETEKSIELARMAALAAWLRGREEQELNVLECLTVHNRLQALAFPYDTFERVGVGRLCVMVPLQQT